MELKLEQQLLSLDGKPIVEGAKPVTVKEALISALLGNGKNDEKLSSVAKLERYHLVLKIKESKKVINLSVDELKAVKDSVDGRVPAFSLLVFGQLISILNGDPTGLKKVSKK